MEFEANPDYYQGKPTIDRVVLKFRDEAVLSKLLSANVNVLTYVDRMDLLKLPDDPRFQVYDRIGPNTIQAVLWNQRHPPFGDPEVRRALTLAIDRRELHRVLHLPDDLPIFDVIFTRRQFRQGDFPEPVPHDPERANQLLDEAGWRDADGNGIREPKRHGTPMSPTGFTGNSCRSSRPSCR